MKRKKRIVEPTMLIETTGRLRTAQRDMDDVASRIPPLSSEQIHALVESDRLPQYRLRRQADAYLLTFCLLVLALAASVRSEEPRLNSSHELKSRMPSSA